MQRRARTTAFVVFFLAVVMGIVAWAQGGLASLGVNDTEAQREIVATLSQGYVPTHLAAKAFKAAAPATRATLVKTAIAWARAYTESAAFRADYARQRQASAPRPPQFKGSVDDELAAQRAERLKGIEKARKNVASLPADMRPQLEKSIKEMEDNNAKLDKDPQMQAIMRQQIEAQRANDTKAYDQMVQQHEKRFPADPRALIARRLQEFLDLSKDVDFGAKLVTAGSKQRFADARYEAQPYQWKLCYRAGREAVAAAREAAQAWLGSSK